MWPPWAESTGRSIHWSTWQVRLHHVTASGQLGQPLWGIGCVVETLDSPPHSPPPPAVHSALGPYVQIIGSVHMFRVVFGLANLFTFTNFRLKTGTCQKHNWPLDSESVKFCCFFLCFWHFITPHQYHRSPSQIWWHSDLSFEYLLWIFQRHWLNLEV